MTGYELDLFLSFKELQFLLRFLSVSLKEPFNLYVSLNIVSIVRKKWEIFHTRYIQITINDFYAKKL